MPPSATLQPTAPIALPEPWLGAWRFATAMTWGGLASLHQLWDPKQLRSFWSTNLSQAMDRTLRSPEFLELLAGSLRAMAVVTRLNSQTRP